MNSAGESIGTLVVINNTQIAGKNPAINPNGDEVITLADLVDVLTKLSPTLEVSGNQAALPCSL